MLKEEVTAEDVATVVSAWTGIPVSKMLEGEREKLLHMEERLGARVIGQRRAVAAVSHAVRRARAGLGEESRPIGSFSWVPRGSAKPSCPGHSRSSCSMTSRPWSGWT